MKLTREELRWSLYDVANSAYILMLTAVMPIYVKSMGSAMGYSDAQTTSHWALMQAAGTFVVALLAPLLGALGDHRGKKKKLFTLFFLLGMGSCAAMALIGDYRLMLAVNLAAALGYAGANNFYDAFLVDVTTDARMDDVSSFGYAIGYIGSCIPFVVCILLILKTPFGLDTVGATKISLLLTAAWWLAFSLPLLFGVRQKYGVEPAQHGWLAASLRGLSATFLEIVADRRIGMFLLAYFFYIDGVDTIIKMSTSFGSDVGISSSQLILALLATQVVAFPAVLICARIAKRFSSRRVIAVSILVYVGICIFGFFLAHAWQFWVLAMAVAVVQGTIQALSRSYFGRLIPKEKNNEYFGFYNILGKYATILGPLLMALFTTLTGSSRWGVLSIAALFVIGFVVFIKSPAPAESHS
ncbi:MAG: MFS transporter [Oscillospiraceae bacterium]